MHNIKHNGCFWNPTNNQFHCPTKVAENGTIIKTAVCNSGCPHDCPEKTWKCGNGCQPLSEPCENKCFLFGQYHKCGENCITYETPCNKTCPGNCSNNFYKQDNIFHFIMLLIVACINVIEIKELDNQL